VLETVCRAGERYREVMAKNVATGRRKVLVRTVRWGLPLLLVIFGVVMILLGHGRISDIQDSTSGSSVFTSIPTDNDSFYSAIGVSALIVAAMVAMIGWFMRMNSTDGFDRQREEAARDYYSRTGRWPAERTPRRTRR
jgi:hypothetical protein